MDIDALNTDAGRALLARAAELLAADPARAAVALRRETDDAELASAALTQAELRRSAVAKFGADAASMFFTRDGLEQASRAFVSRRRAARLSTAGAHLVADLCCGIGSDAFALARAGTRVLAVDRDPQAVAITRASAAALGLDLPTRFEVRCADALSVDLSGVDAVFADPARRVNGRRVFDPARYSPPLPELWQATARVPKSVFKVGPGIDHAVIPPDVEGEWVSVDGSVVEASLWSGFTDSALRRATVIRPGHFAAELAAERDEEPPDETAMRRAMERSRDDALRRTGIPGSITIAGDGTLTAELRGSGREEAPVGEAGEYLYEPDGAVIRAHLVAELARGIKARLGHEQIAYLYADEPVTTHFATGYRIEEVLPFHVKRLREALRQRRIGRLTIKKRGADVVPEQLRAQLKPAGDEAATIVVTRLAGRHVALLCHPLAAAG